ncbi:MAG: SAM-dependent methyltransferase [Parcubacteria group bacterium LiPW_15]|nr:MAG: SAM-dependent methyltransferase [Parcubacteria group bacterium LiPW_15]
MNPENKRILAIDIEESTPSWRHLLIKAKLIYYFFQRHLFNLWLKVRLWDEMPPELRKLWFLNREGGMFREKTYRMCDRRHALKGSSILVPGAGFGHCIFQLAAFRPRKITAFDVYEYSKEWDFVAQTCKDRFGVEVVFEKGGFETVESEGRFDWIISDAVLEHIKDMDGFLKSSNRHLKDDGWFYASFGPIWYGPGGDHVDWGGEMTRWDHLICEQRLYEERFEKKGLGAAAGTLEGDFLFHGRLFSYLRAEEYFEKFKEAGFFMDLGIAKVNWFARRILKNDPDLSKKLDERNVPKFDRFINGFLVWMRKSK